MRDYTHMDGYVSNLLQDVYIQPEDTEHTRMAVAFIKWMKLKDCYSVLDAGCGTAFCQEMFEGLSYTGVCLGKDFQIAKSLGRNVVEEDFNFLEFYRDSFDLVFSRHSLEHSPFPILTLMEWHRVSTRWLGLVMPNPDWYTFVGRNHYSVARPRQIAWWLRRSGWKIRQARLLKSEYWFVCEKMPIIGYEGWAKAPLSNPIYEFERDFENMYGDIDADVYIGNEE